MLLAPQVPETSLIEVTRNVAPMSLLLIVPAPGRDGSVVDGGVVDGGVVDGGVAGVAVGLAVLGVGDVPPIGCSSSVPFTSTLWLR